MFQRLFLTLKLAPRASVLPRAAAEYSPIAATKMRHRIIKSPLLFWVISFLKKRESWRYQGSGTGADPCTGAFSLAS